MPESIQILSDLHLESPPSYDIFMITPKAPYLALLGDIGNAKDPGFLTFLHKQLANFNIVFFILGNHEPYHSSWLAAETILLQLENESEGNFQLLDQTRYDLSPELTILGCTLYSRILPSEAEHVSFGLNDFYHIEDWDVTKHNEAFESDLAWLNDQVSKIEREEPHRKIIVLTHHGPTFNDKVKDPKIVGSKITSGFLSDLKGEKCWESENVKVWAFGHTHFNLDFVDSGENGRKIRVVTNQRGYYFKQADGFEEGKIIDV